jgi:adenylate cyclase
MDSMTPPDLDPRFLPLAQWLVEAGERSRGVGEVLEGYAERLVDAGLPLVRASTHIQTLHSERTGIGRVWRIGEGAVEQHYDYSTDVDRAYDASPIKTVRESRKWLSIRPQVEAAPYSILPDLKADGITHYLVGPVFYSDGDVQTVTFSTRFAEGFPEADVRLLKRLQGIYSRALEIKTLRRMLNEVLSIYVGREPGGRILAGQVRRGDVTQLAAAMLYVDLRGFTQLSNEMDDAALVALLNRYFDCFVPPVVANGGEVLKFIGDAVLAIFPQPEGEAPVKEPRLRALAAAEQGLANLAALNVLHRPPDAPLRAGVALHLGRVAYGNVGSVERQDFTVIGRDVNLVSRLAALCGRTDQALLMSTRFAQGLKRDLRPMGPFRLKGFAERQRVYALAAEAAADAA